MNMRKQYVKECALVASLRKILSEETDQKQHWEDCAGRLMKENEQLRNGIAPTLREANLAVSVLKNTLPVTITKEAIKEVPAQPMEPKIAWWKKIFNYHG